MTLKVVCTWESITFGCFYGATVTPKGTQVHFHFIQTITNPAKLQDLQIGTINNHHGDRQLKVEAGKLYSSLSRTRTHALRIMNQ